MPQTLRADAVRNRERVLQAATELFAKDGLSVSIQEIARHAGVGVGTVGRHFATKDDLFDAILSDGIAKLISYGDELVATRSPGDAFFDYFTATIHAGAVNRGLAERLGQAAVPGTDFKTRVGVDLLCDQLDSILKDAQAAGAVRTQLSLEDVETLMAACMTRQDSLQPVMDAVAAGLRA
jgi:AcrR family transcriptional regulator